VKWRTAVAIILVGALIVLFGYAAYWNLSRIPPVHIDPHLTISDIKTKANVNGFSGQEIVVTVNDSHHNYFSKPLKLTFRITQGLDIYENINREVQPGTIHQLLPALGSGNTGWWVSAEVQDVNGDKAAAPERFIHIGDDDFGNG